MFSSVKHATLVYIVIDLSNLLTQIVTSGMSEFVDCAVHHIRVHIPKSPVECESMWYEGYDNFKYNFWPRHQIILGEGGANIFVYFFK